MGKVNLIGSIAALLASAPKNAEVLLRIEHSLGYARVEDKYGNGYDIMGSRDGGVIVEMFWDRGEFGDRWVISPCGDSVSYTSFPDEAGYPRPVPSWVVWEEEDSHG